MKQFTYGGIYAVIFAGLLVYGFSHQNPIFALVGTIVLFVVILVHWLSDQRHSYKQENDKLRSLLEARDLKIQLLVRELHETKLVLIHAEATKLVLTAALHQRTRQVDALKKALLERDSLADLQSAILDSLRFWPAAYLRVTIYGSPFPRGYHGGLSRGH